MYVFISLWFIITFILSYIFGTMFTGVKATVQSKLAGYREKVGKKFEDVAVLIGARFAQAFPTFALLWFFGAIPKAWTDFVVGLKPFAYAFGVMLVGGVFGVL